MSGTSFSIGVISRILTIVRGGNLKKTNLALRAGLNYPVCLKYVNFLKWFNWVDVITIDGSEHVSITDKGIEFESALECYISAGKLRSCEGSSNKNGIDTGTRSDNKPAQGYMLCLSDNARESEILYSMDKKEVDLQPGRAASSSPSILLVDDEADTLLTYKLFLRSEGYHVEEFSDARSAFQKFISVGPSYYDLVICDIRMPNMNGFQLYQGLKAVNGAVKVIFITALDAAEELATLIPGMESKDIIRKPVDRVQFIKTVGTVLSRPPALNIENPLLSRG